MSVGKSTMNSNNPTTLKTEFGAIGRYLFFMVLSDGLEYRFSVGLGTLQFGQCNTIYDLGEG